MPDEHDYDAYLATAVAAAKEAGALIAEAWGSSARTNVEYKGAVDLVTSTDKACELAIMNLLKDAYPSHRFIGEEGTATGGGAVELTDEPTWMVRKAAASCAHLFLAWEPPRRRKSSLPRTRTHTHTHAHSHPTPAHCRRHRSQHHPTNKGRPPRRHDQLCARLPV
jgi:3'-phosphoadenosine 5'-phosphosulfate (PAPS) 3'-phosphatase